MTILGSIKNWKKTRCVSPWVSTLIIFAEVIVCYRNLAQNQGPIRQKKPSMYAELCNIGGVPKGI